MAPTVRRKINDGLLARVNFPLYAVEMLTSRHVLVAGGGGSSKTGVANGFEIYEIYHNGDRFVAEEIIRHETGANVVMNCAIRNDGRKSYLVAGQESHCQLYHVNMNIMDDSNDINDKNKDNKNDGSNINSEGSIKFRKHKNSEKPSSGIENINNGFPKNIMNNSNQNNNNNSNNKYIKFDIKTGDSVQTDFSKIDPIQRVIRISFNGKLMATGGTDCHIRIWNFPKLNQLYDINAHTKEIDDLDFSRDNKLLASIAKDGNGIIWDLTTGKETVKLKWNPPDGIKYLYKRCRFGVYEGKKDKNRLFTLANPFGKVGNQKGFLQQWDPDTGTLTNTVGIDESLASLAVRDDGRFVAIGTMFTGTVSIYIAYSLQRVLHIPSAHSMFVTGLEFIPINNIDGPAISSNSEAAVLSISVDNKVCIHSLQYRHTIPAWLAIAFIIIILILSFMFCSFIGI